MVRAFRLSEMSPSKTMEPDVATSAVSAKAAFVKFILPLVVRSEAISPEMPSMVIRPEVAEAVSSSRMVPSGN